MSLEQVSTEGNVELSLRTNFNSDGILRAESKINYTPALPPKEKKPKTTAGFILPEPHRIYKDSWRLGCGINDENDTAYLIVSEDSFDLYVNMDCKQLLDKILSDPDNKVMYEHIWVASCLFLWGPHFDTENREEVKKIFNKSFVSIFPLFELFTTLQHTPTKLMD